ncbi:hypothetical protein [Sulfurimonas sp.]|uniref:hypothetical protein n=1 Tax=Sulfurimonas sp. TaxID=2022749 RepID=UPI0025CCBDFF|nr:hypothetical protein [Sulfurimonas sp.]MBW6487529.1 hypothetical protein [Sulfurimonas sp.]
MSTSTQKNYMDLMDEFFFETSKLKSNATNQEVVELLQENKLLINEIAALAKATELFWLSKHKYEEFKKEMFENREKGMERIVFAYQQLLKRITRSLSNIHMRGAIVIAMPLLADALS